MKSIAAAIVENPGVIGKIFAQGNHAFRFQPSPHAEDETEAFATKVEGVIVRSIYARQLFWGGPGIEVDEPTRTTANGPKSVPAGAVLKILANCNRFGVAASAKTARSWD